MSVPDWYLNTIELYQDEDISKLDYSDISELDFSDYIKSALEHGACLVDDKANPGWLHLIFPTESGGQDIVISQGLYGSGPTHNTFIFAENYPAGINACEQCKGIPIWETDKILDSLYCYSCGKPLNGISDIHVAEFAGMACKECAEKINKEFYEKGLYN